METEEHLGDDVYASFDGRNIWLKKHGSILQQIALAPDVFEALVSYVESIHAKHREDGHVTD